MRLALLLIVVSAAAGETTLADYARGKPVRVYTYGVDEIPLAEGDNTNNFAEGDKVLQLSRLGLDSLDGIARLRVIDQGRERAISELDDLHLYLNGNAIRRLPAEFFGLRNLTFLYVNFNRFDAIPPEIATMKKLWGMYWTGNRIPTIPLEVYTMTWLRKLQVSKNRLTRLDPAFGNLTELRHLDLGDNLIEELPDTIGRLKLLRVCDFSGNRLKRLPESFGQVPIVHQLRVHDNPLESLPPGFANMPGSIDITNTRIDPATLPPALRARISREKVVEDKDKKTRPRGPRKRT